MSISDEMVLAIENELINQISRLTFQPGMEDLKLMMSYHMGWQGKGAGSEAQGKRIRPLLVTLCSSSCGGDWHDALPAAAAVELIHNFSLLHDDIEDNSPLRRGRPTVWKLWGIPQAINTGDAMYSLAHLSVFNLDNNLPKEVILESSKLLQQTCLTLTQGQYLDIQNENKSEIPIDTYWQMIAGKTAALIACCCEMGAVLGSTDKKYRIDYQEFGYNLGLAYQVTDDILGVWGDSEKTGKSVASDLETGKKTLPILYGLHKRGEFFNRWGTGRVPADEISDATEVLEEEGAKEFSQKHAERLTKLALNSLSEAKPIGQSGQELLQLAEKLLYRQY